MGDVVNIDTRDWTPGQVARWLTNLTDDDRLKRVLVVVEYKEDDKDDLLFEHMWSKSTRQAMLYITTWTYRMIVKRYFG